MGYLGRTKPSETTSSVLRSTYTGNGSTTTYALPGPVANETSIIATINGVTQQDAAYSTDGSNIIFDAAPASGDSIEIRTLSAVAMSYAPMAGSVVTGIIADGAVTTGKIADSSITTAKIAAGAVVQADIGTNVAGTGPTFSYSSSSGVTCNTGTNTKITFTTSEWDTTGGMYSSSRFTPTVAGYYQVNAATCITAAGNSNSVIYKNGTEVKRGYQSQTSVGAVTYPVNALVYFNGSTDYIEIFFSNNGGSNQTTINGGALTYFQACLVRTA